MNSGGTSFTLSWANNYGQGASVGGGSVNSAATTITVDTWYHIAFTLKYNGNAQVGSISIIHCWQPLNDWSDCADLSERSSNRHTSHSDNISNYNNVCTCDCWRARWLVRQTFFYILLTFLRLHSLTGAHSRCVVFVAAISRTRSAVTWMILRCGQALLLQLDQIQFKRFVARLLPLADLWLLATCCLLSVSLVDLQLQWWFTCLGH